MIKNARQIKMIPRNRIIEPDISVLQMYRNTRVDPHDIDFASSVSNSLLHRYPAIEDFKDRYSSYLGVSSENILLTSGIDGAIRVVFELYGRNSTVVLLEPTYAMYRIYASAFGANVISILPDTNSFIIDEEAIKSVCKNTEIVFIPNPNAPIENVFDLDALKRLADLSDKEGFLLFIDEAYYGFGSPSAIELTKEHNNVFVARSFSKWFGLPAIRLGCIVGNAKKLLEMESLRLAYETNQLSISVANAALNNIEYFQDYADQISRSRVVLKSRMSDFGIRTHGNLSNNILIRSTLGPELENNRILVRQSIPKPAEGWMSVTLGSLSATDFFVKNFEEILNNKV